MFAESFITLGALLALQVPLARDLPTAIAAVDALPAARYVAPMAPVPRKTEIERLGVAVSAQSASVIDVATGRVLFEKEANKPHPIASLTKLVTAMTVLDDRPDMKEMLTILPEDDPREGKTVLPIGGKFTREELFHALLIGSVNTAGNTLARTSKGGMTGFVERMNAKAKDLHLLQGKFVEPTGLEPENQASARDVAILLRTALSYPEIRETTERSALTLPNRLTGKTIELNSTNLLLGSFLNKNPYRIVAAKTGSLPEAGYCLAQATRKEGSGEIIAVVLGSTDHFVRCQDANALTFWAFDAFSRPTPLSARLSTKQ